MLFQGEENDGINVVLIGAALIVVSVICAIVFAVYRLYRRHSIASSTRNQLPPSNDSL